LLRSIESLLRVAASHSSRGSGSQSGVATMRSTPLKPAGPPGLLANHELHRNQLAWSEAGA
jgi:hypothetical protein